MSKVDLGVKRRCASCGTKFYDFKKSPITCPSCQSVFDPEQLLKSRKGRAAVKAAAPAAPAEEAMEDDQALMNAAPESDDDDAVDEDEAFIAEDDEAGDSDVDIDIEDEDIIGTINNDGDEDDS